MSGQGWQPIATAPCDSTRVDLWIIRKTDNFGWRIVDAAWLDGKWREYPVHDSSEYEPEEDYRFFDDFGPAIPVETSLCKVTHWMPLPKAPVA